MTTSDLSAKAHLERKRKKAQAKAKVHAAVSINLLDLHAPWGTYEVDDIFKMLVERKIVCRMSLNSASAKSFRQGVNAMGSSALDAAEKEAIDLPLKIVQANAFRKHISKVRNAIAGFPFASSQIARVYNPLIDYEGNDYRENALRNLTEIEASVVNLQRSIERFDAQTPLPRSTQRRNVNRLVWWFVNYGAHSFVGLTSKPPPVSRTGPFPRYLAAAWGDLGFNTKDKKGQELDLEYWLGSSLEAHPQVQHYRSQFKLFGSQT